MNRSLALVLSGALVLSLAACSGPSPELGKEKSVVCQSCHGVDGNSTDPQFPRLAGQYEDYLVRALTDYRSGQRRNPIMSGFAVGLSDADIANLAAYFARQKNGVYDKR